MPLSWINRDGKLIIAARMSRLFAQGAMSVLVVIYLQQVGFSLIQTGFFIAAGVLGGAFYAILVTLFADVIGRRRFMIFFSGARSVAGIALAATSNFPLLTIVSFFTAFTGAGGGGGAAQPLSQATLAETAPASRRNDLYAVYNMLAMGGFAVGALAAGLPVLLQSSWGMSELGSYRVIMLGYAVFNAVAALLSALLSPAVEVSQEDRHWVNPLTLPSSRKIFKATGLFAVDHFATALVIQSLVAFWFFDRFGIQLQSLALIFFASNIGAASSFWVGAKLSNHFGLINTMAFTQLPSGLLLMALPFVPTASIAILFWLVHSLTHRMAMPMRQSYTMAIVEPQERMAMATLTGMGQSASMTAGPPIATMLWSFASAALPFVASGAIQMSGGVLLYLTFRKVKPPEEARRQAMGQQPTMPQTAIGREADDGEE